MRRMRPAATRTPRASYTDWSEIAPISALTDLGEAVGRAVRLSRDRPQNGQSLSGDLDSPFPKQFRRVSGHEG